MTNYEARLQESRSRVVAPVDTQRACSRVSPLKEFVRNADLSILHTPTLLTEDNIRS